MGKEKTRAKQIAIKKGKKARAMAEGTASLGAAKDCLFRTEGTGVNDHHVNLEFNGAVLTVSPSAEAEGITVNGKPLTKPQQVKTGDMIAFGTHSFEIGPISNAPGAIRRALRLWYIRWPLYGAAALMALLLITFIVAWIYLSPDRISGWITEAVDKNLNCKSKIGSLDYSFSGHVVINDFEIENKPEYSNDALLKITKIETTVSIWDILGSKLRLTFTATEPVVNLHRKMIAGKPSWNFEPFKPVAPAPGTATNTPPAVAPAPSTPPQPAPPPRKPGEPIDIGLKDVIVNFGVKNMVVNVDDELMRRKTKATIDISAVTEGGGKPLNLDFTCLVDSNGRSGKIALKAEANLFNAQGQVDLAASNPARLIVRPGDMINSLSLQAILDHISAPTDANHVFAASELPMEPNLMGSPLDFTVTWSDPAKPTAKLDTVALVPAPANPTAAPATVTVAEKATNVHSVKVNIAHLDDLGINWSVLSVGSIEPLAVDIAGTIDVTGVGKHHDPMLAAAPMVSGADVPSAPPAVPAAGPTAGTGALPPPATADATGAGWVEGDKLHLDFKKIAIDLGAKTLAVDTAVTLSNAKQGQILQMQLTTSASNLDLDGLGSPDLAVQNAAIRKIKLEHPHAQFACDVTALTGSGLGQLALAGKKDQIASLKSGNLTATCDLDGDLSSGLHVVVALKMTDVNYALSSEASIDKGGVNLLLDANIGLTPALMPDHVDVGVLHLDCGIRGKTFPLCDMQNVQLKGLDRAIQGDLSRLAMTADKLQVLTITPEFVAQINPLLKSLGQPELCDLVQVTGEGNLADMKGSVKLHGRVDRIDPEHADLSKEARQPITFEIGLDFRQIDDKHKQVGLDITSGFGETIFHVGLDTPSFENPAELATARMSFTPQQAPGMNLPIRPLIERARAYVKSEAFKPFEKIDMAANPQLVLVTRKLDINQPGEKPEELQSRWESSLAIKNIQDMPQEGKTILPAPTDFNFDLAFNVAYILGEAPPLPLEPGETVPQKGGLMVKSMRVTEGTVTLNNKYCTVSNAFNVGDVMHLTGLVKMPGDTEETSQVLKLPDHLVEKCQIRLEKEAYQLARELIKDRIVLLPLTKDQKALDISFSVDWDAADPIQHDALTFHLESQIDPFIADLPGGKSTNLSVNFKTAGMFGQIKLPFDEKTFDAVDFLFKSNAALDIIAPLSVDQLILLLHNNAVTLHIEDQLVNTINSPLSPISASGKVLSEVHVQFDGQGTASLAIRSDLTDLYLQAKNEDPLHVLNLVKEKQGIPLLLHEVRAQNPQTLPISLALVATAKRDGNLLTIRLDDKDNVEHLGPLTLTFGSTVQMQLEGPTVLLQKADFSKELLLDGSLIAGMVPLASTLNMNGRLHVKSGAQGLDLGKLTAPPASPATAPATLTPTIPAAPAGVTTPTPPAGAPTPAVPAGAPAVATPPPPPPLFDPNLNNATYEVFTAPDFTIEPKPIDAKAQKYKLSLGIKSLTGDLGGNKTGEILLGLAGEHTTVLHIADLRAIAKPEQRSFLQAVSTLCLRANAKLFNAEDQPMYVLEFTNAAQACTRALGLPDPPPAPATPPPAGAPLQKGALDFVQPLTANLDLDLHHIIYDHYEVDALKGKMLLDQGQFQMPEPLTALIYKGTAKVDILVNLVGPHPDIPKILIDVTTLDYNDFMTRAYASPDAVAGTMEVHIEGTGKSALAPDIDSLNLKVITTKSEKTEITDVNKLPMLGPLYSAAASAFPGVLPANPGKIPLGTQTLKNGKLENGYFVFSEFPFHPTEGPLFGYDLVAAGRIHVMDATADPVTFTVTAVPSKVVDNLVATARKDLLVSANKGIPDKYKLTDADLAEADKDMRAKFLQFIADGHLYVRGRGPLAHPKPEMTSPKEVTDLLMQVGMGVMKKKIEGILKKVAEDKAKEGIGNLLGPPKKKDKEKDKP